MMRRLMFLLALAVAPVFAQTTNAPAALVNFNFDQVDIRVLAKLVGEMTGRRFVLDNAVAGKVTVVSPPRMPVSEIYPLFLSILQSSGFTVIERPGATQIVPISAGIAGAPVVSDDSPHAGLITKILRIEHISATELKRALEPLVRGGKEGALSAFGATNHLLITDTADNIRQIEKIIAELDKPGAARSVEVVQLQHSSADEVARQLVAAMEGSESAGSRVSRHLQQTAEGGSSLPADVVVVPAPHANSIILVGTTVQLAEMKNVVAKMDVEAPSGYGRMNAIFLKYLTAEEAAKNLNALLAKTTDKDQRNPIAIEFNTANNALLVDASPQDLEVVRKLISELDQVPQQVLVEVLIAEISMNKNLDLGVQLATLDLPKDGQTTVLGRSRPGETDTILDAVQKGLFPQGLAIGVAHGTTKDSAGNVLPQIPIVVTALARNRDVKILSNVPLWAQNNTEASVSVVENIPILRSTIEGGSGTSRDVIQNIDRVDVGIKLKLTPHVNPDREVQLNLNPSIEAIVDQGPANTPYTPTIAKREISTTVTVPDRATVVITGLMREDSVKDVYKVPLLGDIPILGWLFRKNSTRKERTNLMVFVTPHVVTDVREAMLMKQAMEKKTGIDPSDALLDPDQPVRR